MALDLTTSPASIVRKLLVAKALGVEPVGGNNPPAWQVYWDSEPPVPDEVITVYDTTGHGAGRVMIDGELQGFYGFQVRIRSRTAAEGFAKGAEIQVAMAKRIYDDVVTVDGVRYLVHCVSKISDVMRLGKENPTSKRLLFTVNAVTPIKMV